ncbi:MAG: nicotinate (nicotinamide) nucleotide adenylyltransferase [Candidatus Marinimicrobia bacterium]|nr:nicotinate (nicotinamide) nucleotide adenylyltransferase [Candidatus Neomarinimicrobiota bacterium]|tara:strand:- start:8889 stop:9470 length:582 start_codon:yes stop_codon:yes gene_type:complete
MKLCLFGGTFDPPHLGHLVIAEFVRESEGFDIILFVPAPNPPHKEKNISSIKDRQEMLRLALVDNENFHISDFEIKRGGTSYTIETILEAKQKFNLSSKDIYFLIGSDSLLTFHEWKNYKSILKECKVIVAMRPGFLVSRIEENILSQIRFSIIPQIEISSSQIRNKIKKGSSVRYMLSSQVIDYIKKSALYI